MKANFILEKGPITKAAEGDLKKSSSSGVHCGPAVMASTAAARYDVDEERTHDPYRIIFTGALGVGKSTAINLLIDPIGDTEVIREGSAADQKSRHAAQVFPVDGECGTVAHHDGKMSLAVIDTPGFNDPDLTQVEVLQELSHTLAEIVVGIDTIVHVVRMGRMSKEDRELPELLLSKITSGNENRAELADRWIFLVTHCDSQRKAVTEEQIESFRGEMQVFFPEVFRNALSRAIFVENGSAGEDSRYGDTTANKDQILDQVTSCRHRYHKYYRSPCLEKLMRSALAMAVAEVEANDSLKGSFFSQSADDLVALVKFLTAVHRRKKFEKMTSNITSNALLCTWWNSTTLQDRGEAAMLFTGRALEGILQPEEPAAKWRDLCCPIL